MFFNQKDKNNNYYINLIMNSIEEIETKLEILEEAEMYYRRNELSINENVLYGTYVDKDNNKKDHFRFIKEDDKITCMYTENNRNKTTYIEQEKLDNERTKITKLCKETRFFPLDIEDHIVQTDIIYDKVNNMVSYKSVYSTVNSYDMPRNENNETLINYCENINCEEQIEITKRWYFKKNEYNENDFVCYNLRKNLIGDYTDIIENYLISDIYLKTNFFEDNYEQKVLVINELKLDESLFRKFLEGEITSFEELKEKNNSLKSHSRQKTKK